MVSPLRRHALPPITDGAAAIVLAAGDKARQLVGPAGVDHRLRPPDGDPRPRAPGTSTASPSTAMAAEPGRGGRRSGGRGRDPRPLRPPGDHRAGGARTRRPGDHQPVGRRRWRPTRSCRPASSASARRPPGSDRVRPDGPWPTPPRGPVCNRTWSASWRVSDGRALRSHRSRPDPPQGQAGGCVDRRPGARGGQDGPGRRRPRPGPTSTRWSSARPRTCSRAT